MRQAASQAVKGGSDTLQVEMALHEGANVEPVRLLDVVPRQDG
jgi:hypothetical protein